jgi:hypothetical protein
MTCQEKENWFQALARGGWPQNSWDGNLSEGGGLVNGIIPLAYSLCHVGAISWANVGIPNSYQVFMFPAQ